MSLSHAVLCGVIWILSLCLWDATQLTQRYAQVIAACANGDTYRVGNRLVLCMAVDVQVPEKKIEL